MSPEKPSPPSTSPGGAPQSRMLEVDVEVAGTKQRVFLSSKDIGAGGFFLRTAQPAPLWKKVRLSLTRPGGGQIEMSGEVVRSIGGDQAASGQPTGMAVAFDESSRGKQKDFIALVQSLAAGRIPDTHPGIKSAPSFKTTPPTDPAAKVTPRPAHAPPAQPPPPPPHKPPAPVAHPSPTQPITATGHQNPADLKKFLDDYKNKHTGTTYYDTLGIPLQATPQEIENAYQQLSAVLIITEPIDNLPGDVAEELAAILNKVRKAHAILSKPDRKRAYDFIIDNAG